MDVRKAQLWFLCKLSLGSIKDGAHQDVAIRNRRRRRNTANSAAATANATLESQVVMDAPNVLPVTEQVVITNQNLTSMVSSVNTLVAVESKALRAVETTARKDRNQVGLV